MLKVLERVWSEAVKSTKATQVLIPRGDWNLSQAILSGPNKAAKTPIFSFQFHDPNVLDYDIINTDA